MALSVDWTNRIINIPRADMALIQANPTEIREQSLVTLFNLLREQEASDIGVLYPSILEYTKPLSLGGVTLAPAVNIINNYTLTFEDGQYAVNLVGANSNVADKVNVNQVSVRSANSAGLVQTREIEQAAFGNMIAINQTAGYSGTSYPIGTLQRPCNNLADAKFIAGLRGIDHFHIVGTFTVGATDVISGYTLMGNGAENSIVTLTSGCATSKTTFESMSVSGRQNGETHYRNCDIGALTNVHCQFIQCRLIGPMEMHPNAADTSVFYQCYTGDVAGATFVVDLNNSPCHMSFNAFNGKMQFINMNKATAGIVTVNMNAGKILIDSTCTTGQIKVRGGGQVIDTSNGTIVDNDTSMALVWQQTIDGAATATDVLNTTAQSAKLARQMQTNKAVISTDGLTVTIYADDGISVLHVFDVSSDKNTRTPR